MPKGPFGGPRPFANVPDHLAVYTTGLDSQSRAVVTKKVATDLDIETGDSVRVIIYPLHNNKLNLRESAVDIRKVVGNVQIVIDKNLRDELRVGPGDRVMVFITDVLRR